MRGFATADVGATRDQRGFWSVYDASLPRVYGFLARRVGAAAAEDLTQEVYVAAARSWANGAEVTVPWLLTVARSRLIDHYRAEGRRRRNLVVAAAQWRDVGPSAFEDASDGAGLSARTEAALAALPDAQRTALVLHHADDRSVADVAELLGRSVRATESLLARARRNFRDEIEEQRP